MVAFTVPLLLLAAADCPSRCHVRGGEPVRIAVCFFGMMRGLANTLPSLRDNLIATASAAGATDLFVHTLTGRAQNSHSSEEGLRDERLVSVCAADVLALAPCRFAVQEQAVVDSDEQLSAKATATLKSSRLLYRSYYDVPTLLNVYRSRFSLNQAAKLVIAHQESQGFEYTHVVAVRPDTAVLSPLDWRPLPSGVTTLNFEHGGAAFVETHASGSTRQLLIGGVSDRFAYGDARSMLTAYMTQYPEQLQSLDGVQMTTSETLLCEHLVRHNVTVALTPLCVVRVRATGELATYQGSNDLVYPPRGRPTNCRGLRVEHSPEDEVNGCVGLSWPVAGLATRVKPASDEENGRDGLSWPAVGPTTRTGSSASGDWRLQADNLVAAWEARLPDSVSRLPGSLKPPSPDHPFVFFHLRKSGGTTMRQVLHTAAADLGVESYVACHDASCETYSPPLERDEARRYAVLGGHFHRGGVMRWLEQSGVGRRRPFGCLVMLRRTVDRVASCWNYRFVDEPRWKFHEMTPAPPVHLVEPRVLNESLPIKRSGHAEGCNNEVLRVLSPLALDEGALGHLTSADEWSRYALPALDDALSSLSQCAVVVLERCAETRMVLEHFMPWIAAHYDCSKHLNAGSQKRGELSEAATRVILAQNELDERIYAYGLKQLQMQLQFINASRPPQQLDAPRLQHLTSPAPGASLRPSTSPGALDAAYEVAQLRFKERSATMATSTTLPAVPGRPAIHAVRIPKASSSFLSLLARTLAGCSPEGYPCCRYPGSPAGSCPRRDLDCPLVKGCTDHFPQFADELASNDVEAGPIITVLRRPAERLLSAFFYVPPHRPPDANFSWAAFVAYANERRYQNTMTRMLGAGAHAYADVPAASSLEAARRRLAQLSWIGLSAAPAASTLLLYETEPFRALVPSRAAFLLGIEDAARAALRGHSRPATFTGRGAGDVESVVNSTNAADVSLYASALALFCGRLRATGLLQVPLVHEEAVAAGCDVAPPEPPADARAAPNVSSATAQGAAAAASVEGCDWARHSCAGLPLPAPRAADEADAVADRSPPHSTHDQRARTIWMFWAQGWARAPPLARACAASWGRLNPSWELRLLSTANLSAFSAEPSEAHGYAFRPPEESAQFSDLVRVELLRRHGGLWADASLLPIKPIESWLPRLLPEQGFWAVRGGATQTVSSWLLYAPRPGALVLEMLTAALRQFWRVPRPDPGAGNTGHPCYFSWHLLLRCLVGTYAGVALELERMPRLQAGEAVPSAFAPPRSDANRLGDTLVDERLKEFIRQGPFFKLSIRQEAATMGEDSLLAHFVALGLSGEEAGGCVV